MRSAPSNYTDLLALTSQNPVWLMIVDGLPADRGSFASGNFGDIDSDWQKQIVNVRLRFGTIDLLEPHTDANEYEVEIIDQNLIFTNVLKDYDLLGASIQIKIGFAELDETDFVVLPSVTIERITLQSDYITWQIVAKDPFFRIKQDMFTSLPATNLDGDVTAFDTTISVVSTAAFIDPTILPVSVRAGLIIDNDTMRYSGISSNDFTGVEFCSENHVDHAQIRQSLIFNCDHLIAVLHLLTTTSAGGNGFYDLGLNGVGLGIPYANIEVENIEKLSYRIGRADLNAPAGFFSMATPGVARPDKNLQWIEETFLKPRGCYFFSNNGKIDIGALEYVWYNENYSSDRDFTNDEIGDVDLEFINAINFIRSGVNYNLDSDSLISSLDVQLDDSVDEYEINVRPTPFSFTNFAIDTTILIPDDARWMLWNRIIFNYYGDISGHLNFNTLMRGWLVEPGDDVRLTYDYLPDFISGTRGWTNRKVRILGQEVDFSGSCKFTGISWQLFTRVAGLSGGIYSINKVIAISITDADVAYSENIAETPEVLETEDGYFDNTPLGTSFEADQIIFFIEIEEPGTGSTEELIGIRVSAVNNVGALLGENRYFNIRYDAAGSATREIQISTYIETGFNTIDHIKVEWYYRSSAIADDQPTINFVGAWFILYERDMTLLAPV